MANQVYENFVLQTTFADNLDTKLNAKGYMTIDNSLTANDGMTIKINKYSYSGTVQELAEGAANTVRGAVSITTTPYDVTLSQQVFDYTDEQAMTDSKIIDAGINGGANEMVNDITSKYFAELADATLSQTYAKGGAISYDTVVDAIAKMNLEDESGLFLIIGNDLKAQIRKDADFKAKELGKVIVDGAIGTLSGVPVVCSKAVPAKTAYLATKEAVTCFIKKDSEVEQVRAAETRTNTVIMRAVNLVALTDATKVVKIVEAAGDA